MASSTRTYDGRKKYLEQARHISDLTRLKKYRMEDNGYMGIFIYMIVNIAVDDGKQDEYTSLTMEYRPQCLCIFLRDQYFFFSLFCQSANQHVS
jgi:hypothetical protein